MVRVLFLGGLGRSGTTLLERLLGELPGVCPLGEVVHLWDRDIRDGERCGCDKPFHDCTFWRGVGEEAFGGWHNVDVDRILALRRSVERTRHVPRLAAGAVTCDLVEYANYYARLYRAAAEMSGARVLVDSSKHAALAYCLRQAAGIDLRVVHMVRDSRGVAYSWTKRVSRPEADGACEMTRYRPGRSALLWNAHNTAFGLLGRCGVPVRRVRYEELLADPRGTVRAVASYAGLDAEALDLSFLRSDPDGTEHADLRSRHSAAGNPMRFTVGAVPLRHDEAWRNELRPRQRRLVGALTAPLLGAYGYRS
ncbi:sulfotransferase family protein [Planosporangium mesophilum]|uniref:Sulfotransferase n=1 Tax=Planosporangium mesophilum TaxID=689768 RepID=A0A8J3TFF7_9ACTN|nr:sulfotransferase [Planosporangium mesophilum]NJC84817.1 sulfotransferase [Planosporangium mesophilum]GII24162.1 sulfotransferase [Planosporangium mesophilum]